MFKRILVAVDGSPFATSAVPYAAEIAREFNSDVFVLHVHEREAGRAGAFPLETVDDAKRVVAEAVQTLQRAGIANVTGEVQHALSGHAARHIVDTAAQRNCDLIIMGSRGLSDIAGLMLGSVTHKVLQLAVIPVLVARGGAPVREKTAVGSAAAAAN